MLTAGTPSGGEEVLLDVGGQEATEAFEDVGHSDEARELLDGMFVGNLKRMVCFPPPSPSSPFPYVSSVSLPLVYKISLRPLHQQLSRKKKKKEKKRKEKKQMLIIIVNHSPVTQSPTPATVPRPVVVPAVTPALALGCTQSF